LTREVRRAIRRFRSPEAVLWEPAVTSSRSRPLAEAATQQQFLQVLELDEAQRRWRAALELNPRGSESVSLDEAWGRVLAAAVTAPVDVPSFDRANLDGFAVRAADTYGAREEGPKTLRLLADVIETAAVPRAEVRRGTAMAIATGGMLPRGADAVVMVEHTEVVEPAASSDAAGLAGHAVLIRKPVTPGTGVTFAGTDMGRGETVRWPGEILTSRETGVLAAIGIAQVEVWRQPRVGILSTGNEIITPGQPMRPGMVYDSNARILADAVRELGGVPRSYGIVGDEPPRLRRAVDRALEECDVVLLSGGTSKGAGDVSYQVVGQLGDPGVVAHGVALKPGKPVCLAATRGKPVVVLPGFPTSAIFTFHEFVAPVITRLAGRAEVTRAAVSARLATTVHSEVGRTEYLLVGLVRPDAADSRDKESGLRAFPMGKGSGSVTTFSNADGFVTIERQEEILEQETAVMVQLLGRDVPVADLIVMGSHCLGLDYLMGRLHGAGVRVKFLAVGSTAGLAAVRRGEADLAGIHLLDPRSGQYNRPFLSPELELIEGYRRRQGVVFRVEDERFHGKDLPALTNFVRHAEQCVMVNRNQGSGTRILLDQLLDGLQPDGYAVQARSHNAVAAAVAQGRADWGVAVEVVAKPNGLAFLPLQDEQYDFVVRRERRNEACARFRALLQDAEARLALADLGMVLPDPRR
jgi:putative molybdopterin biosynthesis protein